MSEDACNIICEVGDTTIPGQNKVLTALLAGSIVGCSELLITYPLDAAKTQLHLDRKGDGRYTGIYDVLSKIIKSKGFFALYKGVGVLLVFKGPQEGLRFGVYEQLKLNYQDEYGNVTPAKRFLCGLGAGCCEAILVVTPMETIKVKLINDNRVANPQYQGFFLKSVFKIIRAEGFHGIYQGLTPTIVKQSTNHGIRFFLVDSFKHQYRDGDPKVKISPLIVGVFGLVAGLVSVLCNNPADVVKTRMQAVGKGQYTSTFHCVKTLYNDDGLGAFYKGTKARMLRVGIDAGYTFMCYDIVSEKLNKLIKFWWC